MSAKEEADRREASLLLQWSRTIEQHGLMYEAWLRGFLEPPGLAAPPHVPLAGRTA